MFAILFLAFVVICFWTISLLAGEIRYQFIEAFLKTILGKFLIISLCWTFSFQILNEIRHLVWDAGYGFDLKIAKITGILTLVGSLFFTILFYLIGRNLF